MRQDSSQLLGEKKQNKEGNKKGREPKHTKSIYRE